jgi:hypothetical protein
MAKKNFQAPKAQNHFKNTHIAPQKVFSKLNKMIFPATTASPIDLRQRKMYIMGGGPIMEKEYMKTLLELLKQTPKTKEEAIMQLKKIGVLDRKGELAKSH